MLLVLDRKCGWWTGRVGLDRVHGVVDREGGVGQGGWGGTGRVGWDRVHGVVDREGGVGRCMGWWTGRVGWDRVHGVVGREGGVRDRHLLVKESPQFPMLLTTALSALM